MKKLKGINQAVKTPREILLARHRAAGPKLDRIRAEVVAKLAAESRPDSRRAQASELDGIFLGLRCVFGFVRARQFNVVGLGCVWLVILALRLATRESPKGNFVRSPESRLAMQAAMVERQRLLAELNEDDASRFRKEAPKSEVPRPRSERRRNAASV